MVRRLDRSRVLDVALPALIAVAAAVELTGFDGPGRYASLVLELGGCVLLPLGRRFPLLAPTGAALAATAPPFFGPAMDELAAPLLIGVSAVYALARWNRDLRGIAGMVAAGLGIAIAYAT